MKGYIASELGGYKQVTMAMLAMLAVGAPLALGAAPVKLTSSSLDHISPRWHPGGATIAYMKLDASGAYQPGTVDVAGTGEAFLATVFDVPANDSAISWLGNSTTLLVVSGTFFQQLLAFDTTFAPYSGNGGNAFTLKLEVPGGYDSGAFVSSRDGLVVAWRSESSFSTEILSAPYASLADQNINAIGTIVLSVPGTSPGTLGMCLTPDGSQLVISLPSGSGQDLWVYNTSGVGAPVQLTFDGASSGILNLYPDVSPDGTKILFQRGTSAAGSSDIYMMNLGGGGLTQVTSTPHVDEGAPSWSPDGTQYAFQRLDGAQWNIYRDFLFPARIVIAEVYGGGGESGATFDSDYIVLFNRGCSAQNVNGWSIQYAEALGNGWGSSGSPFALPNVTIPPGASYLIKLASGGANGVGIGPADATGTINLNATVGKVALVSSTTPLNGNCPSGGNIVDFVGYGPSVDCGGAPAPSVTASIQRNRNGGGCLLDTGNNAYDFTAATLYAATLPFNSAAQVFLCCDFGGAPAPYPTLLANNGARHIIGGPKLGDLVYAEPDGQPSANALNSSGALSPDDDGVQLNGVSFLSPRPGLPLALSAYYLTGTPGAKVDAWIDFNADGDWDDAGEQILTGFIIGTPLPAAVIVPANAHIGTTYARFRISSAGGLSPWGPADDGEVEDYAVEILPPLVDLSLTQSAAPEPASPGGSLTYTLTVRNSLSPATHVLLTDTLPTGVTYVSSSSSQGSCTFNGASVICDLGPLAGFGSTATATVTINVTVNSCAPFDNTATVSANESEGNPADNSATFHSTVTSPAPVFTNCPVPTLDLGSNPASLPDCDPTVGATGDGGVPTVSCARVDTTNGCARTRTLTYTAVDACNQSSTCTQVITWTMDCSTNCCALCTPNDYVTNTIHIGAGVTYYLANNFCHGTNNLLSAVLPSAPNLSTAQKWDSTTQVFIASSLLIGGWSQDFSLDPGEGFTLTSPVAFDLTLNGCEPTNCPLPCLPDTNGCALVGRLGLGSAMWTNLSSCAAVCGAEVRIWNGSAFDHFDYINGVWSPSEPMLATSQSAFVCFVPNTNCGPCTPPVITNQPANQTTTECSSATFTVTATGSAPLSYQWNVNGTPIADATDSSYTQAPLSQADDGTVFTVVITNVCGSVTSAPAALQVVADITPPTLVSATADCANNIVCLTFSEPLGNGAWDIFNYFIDDGMVNIDASSAPDDHTVCLETDPGALAPGVVHTVTVNNVMDLCNNPILPDSQISFVCPTAPTVQCPNAATVECSPAGGTTVSLSAQAGDLDGDGLTVTWQENAVTLQTSAVGGGAPPTSAIVQLTHTFAPGTHQVTVTVSDGHSAPATCSTSVTVIPATDPPTVICPPDGVTVVAGTNCQGIVPQVPVTVRNNCVSPGSFLASQTQSPPAGSTLGVGTYPVTVTLTDANSIPYTCTTTMRVLGPAPAARRLMTVPGIAFSAQGIGIAVDGAGNVYETGFLYGTANFGGITLTSSGSSDIFVVKYDSAGNGIWGRTAGGADTDSGQTIAVDSAGNVYVTGSFGYFQNTANFGPITLTSQGYDDIFVVKYDASGNVLWARDAGGTSDDGGYGVGLDAAGNCYITGYIDGTATFDGITAGSGGGTDAFVAKYDPTGNVVWVQVAGNLGTTIALAIAVDPAGDSYITGYFEGSAQFGGTTLTSSGGSDVFVAKYDPSGNVLWAVSGGGTGADNGTGIGVDAAGNCYVSGIFENSATFGGTTLTSNGSSDLFLAKYDGAGQPVWAVKAGGGSFDDSNGMAVDAAGNSYITGLFESTVNFGGVHLTSAGPSDLYLAKYNPAGQILWVGTDGGGAGANGTRVAVDSAGCAYVTGMQGVNTFIDVFCEVPCTNCPPPMLNCAGDKTVECGSAWMFDSPTVTTNCCGTNVTLAVLNTTTNGIGCSNTVTRTWSVTDCTTNMATCSQTVTIVDTTPPVFTSPSGSGAVTAYTDRAPWQAVAGSGTTIDFSTKDDGSPITDPSSDTGFASLVLSGVEFQNVRSYWDSMIYVFANQTLHVNLPPGTLAWGTGLGPFYGNPGSTTITLSTGDVFTHAAELVPWTEDFFGVVSTAPIAWVELTFPNDALLLDNFSFATETASGFAPPTAVDACSTNVSVTLLSAVTNGLCPQVVTLTWQAADNCGNTTSTVRTVTIPGTTPPTITAQPQSQTTCQGTPVTFTVGASSGQSLVYQWLDNGIAVGGATSSIFNLPDARLSDAGAYSVVVSGSCGSVTSAPATLTVIVCGQIAGTVFAETDFNCVKNPGDPALIGWQVQVTASTYSTTATTDSAGHYSVTVPPGNYTVSAVPQLNYVQTCPFAPNNYAFHLSSGQFAGGLNFVFLPPEGALCPNLWVDMKATYPGLESLHPVHIFGPSRPCCGADMVYNLQYGNNGSVAASGATIQFVYPGAPVGSIVSITTSANCPGVTASPFIANTSKTCPPPADPSSGLEIFTLPTPLLPNEHCTIAVRVHLCCDVTAICSNQAPLNAVATIYPLLPNECNTNYADNVAPFSVRPCCSQDPNDCTVTPAGCGPDGFVHRDQALTYFVQFQNDGGGAANLVVVRDILDEDLDLSTLEILGGSHQYTLQQNGRELLWVFPNIQLAPENQDEDGSRGFVTFRVRPRADAPVGTVILNSAAVFFDANEPVITITTTNTITEDPVPVAAFTVLPHHGSAGAVCDFLYTGGTPGAQCQWSFGANASPQTSTDLNPSGVIFTTPGEHTVGLETSLGDCAAEPTARVVTVGFPRLSLALTDTEASISWVGDGFVVQEAASLAPPVQWQTIQAMPVGVGSSYLLSVPLSAGPRFYRLGEAP